MKSRFLSTLSSRRLRQLLRTSDEFLRVALTSAPIHAPRPRMPISADEMPVRIYRLWRHSPDKARLAVISVVSLDLDLTH